jgi:hypothetical protein
MKSIKKMFTTLALAVTLFTSMPAPKAEAGLILLPTGVGIVFIVLGVVYDRLGLFILDGDQTLESQLESKLAEKYSFIDDTQAIKDLAALVATKVDGADLSAEQVEIKLSREEILKVLEPTGLAELETEKVEAMIAELN